MHVTTILAGAAIAFGALMSRADAALIVNGDFSVSVPNNASGGGWTTSTMGTGWSATGGNPGGRVTLNHSGQLATDPTISQLVSGLVAGTTYRLDFDLKREHPSYGGNRAPTAPYAFAAFIDGTIVLEYDIVTTDSSWHSLFTSFIAPSGGSVLLAFAAERHGTDRDYAIDNVALTALAAVPEPATAAMLAGGLLGVGWLRRRRDNVHTGYRR